MDSFILNTSLEKMKRDFNQMVDDSVITREDTIRQNILSKFDEHTTPLKVQDKDPPKARSLLMQKQIEEYTPPFKVQKTDSVKGRSLKAGALDSENSDLKQQLDLKSAECLSLKSTITHLERRLSSADLSGREEKLEYDRQLLKFRTEREREAKEHQEMRSKLQYVMKQERFAREEVTNLESEILSQKRQFDIKIMEALKARQESEENLQMQQESWHETECNLQGQIVALNKENIALSSQYKESQAQLALRGQRDSSQAVHLQEVDTLRTQLKQAQDRVKTLENQLTDHEDDLMVTKALKADLDRVPQMKNDLERLRLDNEHLKFNEQNCLLLEEEVRSLKTKLKQAEEENKCMLQLEVDNEELKGRLQRWESQDESGSRRPQSPSSLSRKAKDLETTIATLKLKEGELQTKINSANLSYQQSQEDIHNLTIELEQEKNSKVQLNENIKKLKRKVLFLTKEKDSFKELINSYESEVTVDMSSEKQAHWERQEAVLQDYQQQVAALEVDLGKMEAQLVDTQTQLSKQRRQSSGGSHSENSSLMKELRLARGKTAEVEVLLEKVQEEKSVLEARLEQGLLQGDYDPSKTKVLHFSFNPVEKAHERLRNELENLRKEVETLRKRNKLLEESGGAVMDITAQVEEKMTQPSPSKELEKVKEKLHTEELRNKRLKEVFKKTSKDFRDVCFQLTGYRIDIPCTDQYRLTNMYSESSKDHLLFQQKDGNIQLLETDYSCSLQESLDLYLGSHHSIPALLSSITLNLFRQLTMVT